MSERESKTSEIMQLPVKGCVGRVRINQILLILLCISLASCLSNDVDTDNVENFQLEPSPISPTVTDTIESPKFLGPTPTPTLACETHTASTILSSSANLLEVGEQITVKVTIINEGCVDLGLLQFRLDVETDSTELIFEPGEHEPIEHALAISPGHSDTAEFILRAVRPGQVILSASTSFEVHLGYPGPAYWGQSHTKEPVEVKVVP